LQPAQTILSITRVGTTATITFTTDHYLLTGSVVTISGAVPSDYNGTFVFTKTGAATGTYETLTTPSGSASVVGAAKFRNFLIIAPSGAGPIYSYTLEHSILPLNIIEDVASSSVPVTSGLHTYDITKRVMYLGNGSSVIVTPRLFVGECDVDDASLITNKIAYKTGKIYITDPFSFSASTKYTFSHNFGVVPMSSSVSMICVSAEYGYLPGDEVTIPTGYTSPNFNTLTTYANRNEVSVVVNVQLDIARVTAPIGAVVACTPAKWQLRIKALRGF